MATAAVETTAASNLFTQTRPKARPHQGTQICTRHKPCRDWDMLDRAASTNWIREMSLARDTHARGGGGGGGASAGSSESVDHSILQRVKAALSTPVARIHFAELRALLDAVPPNSLTISKKLAAASS